MTLESIRNSMMPVVMVTIFVLESYSGLVPCADSEKYKDSVGGCEQTNTYIALILSLIMILSNSTK